MKNQNPYTIKPAETYESEWPHSYYFLIKPKGDTIKENISYYVRMDVEKIGSKYKRRFYRERFIETEGTFSEKKPFMSTTTSVAGIKQMRIINKLKAKAEAGVRLIHNGCNAPAAHKHINQTNPDKRKSR